MNTKWLIAVLIIMAAVVAVVWYPLGEKPVINENGLEKPQDKQTVETMTDIMTDQTTETQTEFMSTPPFAQSQNGTHYPDRFPKHLPPSSRIPANSILHPASADAHQGINNTTPPQTMYNYSFPKHLPEGANVPAEKKN